MHRAIKMMNHRVTFFDQRDCRSLTLLLIIGGQLSASDHKVACVYLSHCAVLLGTFGVCLSINEYVSFLCSIKIEIS